MMVCLYKHHIRVNMRKTLIFCFLISMLVFSSCESKTKSDNVDFIDYEKFTTLFYKMNTEMKLTNYVNLGGNEGVELVYIDKRLSFDKRNYLTLDNEQSNLSTQQRIEYKDDDDKILLVIDLIYLDKPLNNDLIYWSNPLSSNSENEFIRETFIENIVSYNNVLIKMSLFAIGSNKLNDSMLTDISVEVIDYIQSIKY